MAAGKRLTALRAGAGTVVTGLVVEALRNPENVSKLLALVAQLDLPGRARQVSPKLLSGAPGRKPDALEQRITAIEALLSERSELFPPEAPVEQWQLAAARLRSALPLILAANGRERRARVKELGARVTKLQDEVLAAMLAPTQTAEPSAPGASEQAD